LQPSSFRLSRRESLLLYESFSLCIYFDRTFGRHRHHRDFGRDFVSRVWPGQGKCAPFELPEQLKQIGLGILQYIQDYDERYPQAYWYKTSTATTQGSGTGGYVHISAMLNPYIKSAQVWVCPSDATGGMRPTNPAGDLNDFSTANTNDAQVARISYIANSAVLPRKRGTLDAPNTVNASAISSSARVIMFADMNDSEVCLTGSSNVSGTNLKSHRSANAVSADAAGAIYAGEHVASTVGGAPSPAIPASVYAVPVSVATSALDSCKSGTSGLAHITYAGPSDHFEGANYAFADGHVKWYRLAQTLNQDNWLWGAKMYGTNTPVLKTDGSFITE
jgi:prepilin-type processing-associated H-X9-DG protein